MVLQAEEEFLGMFSQALLQGLGEVGVGFFWWIFFFLFEPGYTVSVKKAFNPDGERIFASWSSLSPGELRWVGGEQKGVPPGALGEEDNLVGLGVGCWWKAGCRPSQNLKILQGRIWQQRSDICRGGLMNCGEYTRWL